MSDTKINNDNVIALLEKVVETRGEDYIDPRAKNGQKCLYVYRDEGVRRCIVGELFSSLGVGDDELSTYRSSAQSVVRWTGLRDRRKASHLVGDVLQEAQHAQDRGESWGMALQAAKNRLAEARS